MSPSPNRRSARRRSSWMATARSTGSRRCISRKFSRRKPASPGSRSRSRRTISPACSSCARARPPAWRSRPANTATRPDISAACWRRKRWTCSRPTSRAAAASPGSCKSAALCDAHHIDLSGHCGPAAHLHAACAAPRFRHLEWFHDHVRIEHMLFDGAPTPQGGMIRPDLSRPGLGLEFRRRDAEKYRQ